MMRWLFLWMILWSASPAWAIGVDAAPLPNPAQEQRARALMAELRCLVCQNQSLLESDADLAVDLRRIVREHVARNESDAQIKAFLVARYGSWILFRPPVTQRTWLLWFGPLVFLILGTSVILRRTARPADFSAPLSPEEQHDLERITRR